MRRLVNSKGRRQEMAWNEPGGSGDDKDPWGSRGGDQGPPDLDEVVRKLQEKFNRFFGGGKSSGGGSGGGASSPLNGKLIGTLIIIALIIWGLTGFYIVNEGNRGVVLRFGEYTTTTQSGLHWHLPYPVETVMIVNVEEIRNVEVGYRSGLSGQGNRSVPREALMLTQDENIIDIEFAIQYRIKDARDYLFNVSNPDETLHNATESAVREIIGKSKMDFVLTEGRSEIVARAKDLIQGILDDYKAGLQLTSVNMQDAQPPEQVQAAFSDAVKAREDEVRLKNEAEAYSNDILPKARGQAARMLEDASAYKDKVIAQAEGDASRFTQILTEYSKAPEVTRQRLYLDAVEGVLNQSTKVMLDVKEGNNLLYLPLDRIIQQTPASSGSSMSSSQSTSQQGSSSTGSSGSSSSSSIDQNNERLRSTLRSREVR